jgi:N-acetylglucosamine-6-phosphate deacetylase
MIFTSCRVILPDGIRDDLEVVVDEGQIVELREWRSAAAGIDLCGNYLAPGFIDLHVHGGLGRDAMEATSQAFRAICHHHLRGGTTSLLLTTATAPIEQILHVIETVRTAKIPQITGVHVEGPFISRAKAGAQNAEFIREPTGESVARLLKERDLIKRITIAPEVNGALEAIAQFSAAGIRVSGGHSEAWDEEVRAGFERGMRSVTHTFNCMSGARRRGIHRVAGLIEFALAEPEICCELIADGHHVSPTLMKMLYRAKGAGGISLVTDASAGAGLRNGSVFKLARKKCVVEDGVCLLADKSALAGSAAGMIDLVRTMVSEVGVPLHEAVAMASRNPARQIGLSQKGEIAIGKNADFVVLSPQLEIERVFLAGQLSFRTER